MDPSTLAGASTATCGAANILRCFSTASRQLLFQCLTSSPLPPTLCASFRVPLLEKKEKINQILGERQVAYWRLVEMFLRAQLSKQELDDQVSLLFSSNEKHHENLNPFVLFVIQMTQIFGVEKLHYHNDLILVLCCSQFELRASAS